MGTLDPKIVEIKATVEWYDPYLNWRLGALGKPGGMVKRKISIEKEHVKAIDDAITMIGVEPMGKESMEKQDETRTLLQELIEHKFTM